MDAVKAKIKVLSLNPAKNYFSKSRPWKTEVELRLKMNSDSWYNRANRRRKFHFYVDEGKDIIPDSEELDDKEDEKVKYLKDSFYELRKLKILKKVTLTHQEEVLGDTALLDMCPKSKIFSKRKKKNIETCHIVLKGGGKDQWQSLLYLTEFLRQQKHLKNHVEKMLPANEQQEQMQGSLSHNVCQVLFARYLTPNNETGSSAKAAWNRQIRTTVRCVTFLTTLLSKGR